MPPKKLAKGKKGKKGRNIKRPEDVDSLAQNMTALSVGGTSYNTSANEEEKTNDDNVVFGTRAAAAQRSPKWEHFDASGRGFKLYTPDGYVTSLEDAHLLIIVDHPIDYGLYDHPRGPCSLGMDGLYAESTLNTLIRALINRMCEGNYNWDVAKCLLMTSVVVSYTVFMSGPVNWIDNDRNKYLTMTNESMRLGIDLNKEVIRKMKNIIGCITVGEEAFHATTWLRKEYPTLSTNKQILPPAKDIEKYTPSQRDVLLGCLDCIIGSSITQLTPDRRQQCLCPDYEMNEKMAQHPGKKFKYDEKSRKMAVEGAAQRKLDRLKVENDEVANEDNVIDEDEAPEVD